MELVIVTIKQLLFMQILPQLVVSFTTMRYMLSLMVLMYIMHLMVIVVMD